jgi:diguanylate cyclase
MKSSGEAARAKAFAETAIRCMNANDVPPTPENYAVWYGYVSGLMPELKRTIDILLSNRQSFTPEVCADLHGRFFDANAQMGLLEDTGGKLRHAVEEVVKSLGAAAGDATSFGKALDKFSTAIDRSEGTDKVRGLISGLIGETQRMAERNRTLEERLSRSASEVEELRQNLETVRREALTDPLTGIPNRKHFDTRLREAARDAMEAGEPLSLLLADIDHFKRFNDTYGHPVGDQVLRLVARTLTDSVKGRDTPTRYGGEEFAIILPQTTLSDAAVVAEQIRSTMMRRKLVGKDSRDNYGTVTLSLGAAQYRPGETLGDLVRRADAALYHAKRTGRNRVAIETMLAEAS